VVEWIDGKDAPAFDLDMLIAMSNVGRDLLLAQPKLTLVQTASDGYAGKPSGTPQISQNFGDGFPSKLH